MFLIKCFEAISENIDEALVVIDEKGYIVTINDKAKLLLGVEGENIGKYIEDVVPETNLPRVLKTGENEIEKNFVANSREFITSRIAIISDGEIQGALALFRDITEHNKLKRELKEEKTYIDVMEMLMNTFNEWAVVIDENGVITMMTQAYKEFIGVKDPVGKNVEDVIENTKMYEVLETGKSDIGGIQEIKGNKMIAMRVPIKKDNKIVGAVGKVVFKDISDFYSLSKKLNNLEKEVEFYKNQLSRDRKAKYSIQSIIGESTKMEQVKSMAERVAKTSSNVLIIGESGTGKELFAHAIHNSSKRRLAPFIEVNCAAIPSELMESEFFGYEEGAFTGARKGGKKGKFELANGGTLFLDEIGDMPMKMQVKLLRVLQEKEIERVGGNTIKKIDVRIIAATNKNLELKVKEGTFRQDLYYRLNVMKITLPLLKERKDDIPVLANALRIKVSSRLGVYVEGISKEALNLLVNYDWPGNVRELENVIESSINLLDSSLLIEPQHLPEKLTKQKFKKYRGDNKYLKDVIKEVEKDIIEEYLTKTDWNKNKTAKLLGISRVGLYKKIEEYGLEKQVL